MSPPLLTFLSATHQLRTFMSKVAFWSVLDYLLGIIGKVATLWGQIALIFPLALVLELHVE